MKKNRYFELLTVETSSFKSNQTSKYLLPSIELNLSGLKMSINFLPVENSFEKLKLFGLQGVYSYWEEDEDNWTNCLFLLFSPKKDIIFQEKRSFNILYEELLKTSCFRDIKFIELGKIVLIMQINPRWYGIKEKIMNGMYSKVDKNYANLYFKNSSGVQLEQYEIINKTEYYRKKLENDLGLLDGFLLDYELDSIPDKQKETLICQ